MKSTNIVRVAFKCLEVLILVGLIVVLLINLWVGPVSKLMLNATSIVDTTVESPARFPLPMIVLCRQPGLKKIPSHGDLSSFEFYSTEEVVMGSTLMSLKGM